VYFFLLAAAVLVYQVDCTGDYGPEPEPEIDDSPHVDVELASDNEEEHAAGTIRLNDCRAGCFKRTARVEHNHPEICIKNGAINHHKLTHRCVNTRPVVDSSDQRILSPGQRNFHKRKCGSVIC